MFAVVAALSGLGTACAGTGSEPISLRRRASLDLQCPEERLRISDQHEASGVTGCGRRARYVLGAAGWVATGGGRAADEATDDTEADPAVPPTDPRPRAETPVGSQGGTTAAGRTLGSDAASRPTSVASTETGATTTAPTIVVQSPAAMVTTPGSDAAAPATAGSAVAMRSVGQCRPAASLVALLPDGGVPTAESTACDDRGWMRLPGRNRRRSIGCITRGNGYNLTDCLNCTARTYGCCAGPAAAGPSESVACEPVCCDYRRLPVAPRGAPFSDWAQ
jgi:hypothetical protein